MTAPAPGTMVLYDAMLPPLADGAYQVTVSTEVTTSGEHHERPLVRHFTVDGPRFNLPAGDVARVFPPRNGRGDFEDVLPQIALGRRTLPWERKLDAGKPIPPPTGTAPLAVDAPWLALLLFEDDEAVVVQNVPLERVVPAAVFKRLGSPTGILCDAVEADTAVLAAVMPSKEELKLLVHVRQVNVDDRELATGSSDGFFAVVVANRLPSPGARCRACLVSLEERSDLVAANPPPEAVAPLPPPPPAAPAEAAELRVGVTLDDTRFVLDPVRATLGGPQRARLVLLHTWSFECDGTGTFRELMQGLQVAMFGHVAAAPPQLTDSGHLALRLADRVGAVEDVRYRGPLVGQPLTRDPLGPYHSADQARRLSVETGVEDISYAAAFEVGRLLAASDHQLAQQLLRWRRDAYQQSARLDVVAALQQRLAAAFTPDELARLDEALVPMVAVAATGRMTRGAAPIADPSGLDLLAHAAGLDPVKLGAAWSLSTAEAKVLLGDAGTLGAVVPAMPATPRSDTTLAAVAGDRAGLARLTAARLRLLANAATRTGGK